MVEKRPFDKLRANGLYRDVLGETPQAAGLTVGLDLVVKWFFLLFYFVVLG